MIKLVCLWNPRQTLKLWFIIKICTPAVTARVCHQYKVIYLFRLVKRGTCSFREVWDPEQRLPSPKESSLVLGSGRLIESGVSSLLLTAPRCLLKTPSSPAKARRKCGGPASPKEQRNKLLSPEGVLAAKPDVCKHLLSNLSLIIYLVDLYQLVWCLLGGRNSASKRGYFTSPEFEYGSLFGSYWSDLDIWGPCPIICLAPVEEQWRKRGWQPKVGPLIK